MKSEGAAKWMKYELVGPTPEYLLAAAGRCQHVFYLQRRTHPIWAGVCDRAAARLIQKAVNMTVKEQVRG